MKKFSFYACTAATVLFAGSFATAAHGATVDTYNFPGGKAVIIGGGSCNGNFGGGNSDGWQTILGQLQGNLGGGCFSFPNTTQPGGSQQPDMPSFPDAGPITPDEEDPGQSGSISQSEYAAQVVKLVNEERSKAGLKPLSVNTKAEKAASVRVKELEKSFSHTRPNGSDFSTALKAAGINYQSAGENIAYGQKTPAIVMKDWMNSPGHKANILGSQYTSIAVSHYQNTAGVDYWEQLFIR